MSHAVSRRSVTTDAPVLLRASPCEIGGGQSCTGTGLLSRRRCSPVSVSCFFGHSSTTLSCITSATDRVLQPTQTHTHTHTPIKKISATGLQKVVTKGSYPSLSSRNSKVQHLNNKLNTNHTSTVQIKRTQHLQSAN